MPLHGVDHMRVTVPSSTDERQELELLRHHRCPNNDIMRHFSASTESGTGAVIPKASTVVGYNEQHEQPSRYCKRKEKTDDDRNCVMSTTCGLAVGRISLAAFCAAPIPVKKPNIGYLAAFAFVPCFSQSKSKLEVMAALSCSTMRRLTATAGKRSLGSSLGVRCQPMSALAPVATKPVRRCKM